jgi:uncharacterized membrane protein YkvA (DUF1232 family)
MVRKLKALKKRFVREIKVYKAVLKDPKTPLASKFLLGAAIAYAVSPIDLIPDFIPVVGYLDDIVIVPLLIYLALKGIPHSILRKHQKKYHERR